MNRIENIFRIIMVVFLPALALTGIASLFYSIHLNSEPFYPNTCRAHFDGGKYIINAQSDRFFQSNRILGGTNTPDETEQLARKLGCKKYITITGESHDLNH